MRPPPQARSTSVAAALGCMLFGYVAWTLIEYFGDLK